MISQLSDRVQLLCLRKAHQPQLAADRVDAAKTFQHADAAVGVDGDFLVGRLEYDRAGIAKHRMAGGGGPVSIAPLGDRIVVLAETGPGPHGEPGVWLTVYRLDGLALKKVSATFHPAAVLRGKTEYEPLIIEDLKWPSKPELQGPLGWAGMQRLAWAQAGILLSMALAVSFVHVSQVGTVPMPVAIAAADYVCRRHAGRGAVREICEVLLGSRV